MKNLSVLFFAIFLFKSPNIIYAQEITATKPDVRIEVSGLNGTDIKPSIDIEFKFTNDIPNNSFVDNNQVLDSLLLFNNKGTPAPTHYHKLLGKNLFTIRLNINSKEDLDWYFSSDYFKIESLSDIEITLDNGNTFNIPKKIINEIDFSKLLKASTFDNAMGMTKKERLRDALGGFKSIYYNKFDLGWRESSSDSTSNENYLEFAKAFKLPSTENFFIELEGLLSTDINDVAAYLQVSPVNFRIGKQKKLHFNASYQTSANQDEQRVMGRVSWRGLIDSPVDNLVANLSAGTNRIRLKPYLNAGLSVMYFTESDNAGLKEGRFIEPFVSFLYIIPIADKYTARLDTYAYWRSTKDKLDLLTENINWQGTIQIEYGIGSNAQIVGKYSYGTFGLTNETNNRLMFGFATELFKRLN